MASKNLKALVPPSIKDWYHFAIAHLGAVLYGDPSKKLFVVGVTGTKGKSSTVEMVNAILEEAGYTTALLNSIRIKIADHTEKNTMRMSMPGRFFIQHFLSRAVEKKCNVAVLEMTSEGARQHRHRGIEMDALIFTNLSPEHIESHGSLQAYADAKFELAKQLLRSTKRPRFMIANGDDPESLRYLRLEVEKVLPFSIKDFQPEADDRGGHFTIDDTRIDVALPGMFSLKNALAASMLARALEIPLSAIQGAFQKLTTIPGRAERIDAGQNFTVVVDYAHTPDSLQALYEAYESKRKICILGSTGGGRDMWKRPVMGKIADEKCDTVILTNEDPYDEDPKSIIEGISRGMARRPEIILDRRAAIAHALSIAKEGDAVLISGKGTDPTIQLAGGKSVPWSDATVVREEIEKLKSKSAV